MIFLHVIKQSEYLHDIHNKPFMVYTNNGITDALVEYDKFDWSSIVDKIYTTDLLYLKYIGIDLPNIEDLSFAYYYKTNKTAEKEPIQLEGFYRSLYPNLKKTNMLIPPSFLLDQCRCLYKAYEPYIAGEVNQFYKKQLDVFHKIESSGLMYKDAIHNSEYNFYTTTGRPSNRFGGTNFAALNKKDGTRNQLKSKYTDGVLIEVDFESYHPRLIADLIGYEFPANLNVYEYLARFYNKTYKPTQDQIKKAKDDTFRRMYGGLTEHDDIPYFKQAHDYVESLWSEFTTNRQISTPISKRFLYYDNYETMNKLMFFNYLVQLVETERNIELLHNNPLLDKIVLYIYDAILLDVPKDDVASTIEAVTETIASVKYPVKIKVGDNYGEMQVWSGKRLFIQKEFNE